MNKEQDSHQESKLERCLECSECRKPIHTCYSICSQNGIQRIGMCEDCPMLQKKLYRNDSSPPLSSGNARQTSLCCGGCGLTRDEVMMGSPLGCSLCYEVFHDEVFHEIIELGHLPNKLKDGIRSPRLHIGKTPTTQQHAWDPAVTLVSLQKTLQETLSREDYEQAAWIRDKIQALTKKQQDSTDGSQDTSLSKP